jgi:hypothetical protein
MASIPGRQLLRVMSMEGVTAPSQSNDSPCPACTRCLRLAVLLQHDDKRLVMCPHYGWETHE